MRDWGHAADYCGAYHEMLLSLNKHNYANASEMMSYVIATDQSCTVKDFVEEVYTKLGFQQLHWSGAGVDEKLYGVVPQQGSATVVPQLLVEVDRAFFRPGEVPYLHGDTSKVRRELGWRASTSRSKLISEMIKYNQKLLEPRAASSQRPKL